MAIKSKKTKDDSSKSKRGRVIYIFQPIYINFKKYIIVNVSRRLLMELVKKKSPNQ